MSRSLGTPSSQDFLCALHTNRQFATEIVTYYLCTQHTVFW